MGCDGVFETLEHPELLKFINQRLGNQVVTPQVIGNVAEDLLDNLLAPDTSGIKLILNVAGTGCDNMTTLIIYLKGK